MSVSFCFVFSYFISFCNFCSISLILNGSPPYSLSPLLSCLVTFTLWLVMVVPPYLINALMNTISSLRDSMSSLNSFLSLSWSNKASAMILKLFCIFCSFQLIWSRFVNYTPASCFFINLCVWKNRMGFMEFPTYRRMEIDQNKIWIEILIQWQTIKKNREVYRNIHLKETT